MLPGEDTLPLSVAMTSVFGIYGLTFAVLAAAVFALDGGGLGQNGLIVGSTGLLGFLFRYWFKETKRKDAGVWEIADEYRIERDYYREVANYWQATAFGMPDPPPLPNLDSMKAEARAQAREDRSKETKKESRGRR